VEKARKVFAAQLPAIVAFFSAPDNRTKFDRALPLCSAQFSLPGCQGSSIESVDWDYHASSSI